ncbi:rhamnan synthesis F family protein [Aureimonas sp. Leaf454]|uniref:rhamnan synthesis F family protein n=1 Tax=Aureimonas sp. Leaf454 TaxID=1736381 RepID=UPI0012E3F808|nr:rhamnan synthesis F family protein [Aureimonas sp. Leaf454]
MSLASSLGAIDVDPLFWVPTRLGQMSAWWGHVPFAHWLVATTKPDMIVELGTHNGVSYSAFCEAAQRTGAASRAYAVDTWQGDEHAGLYDDSVFQNFSAFNKTHYASFSELMRMTFDEAALYFADGSIDLLHIDGLHTYEAVRHDFETWRPKMSTRGVVLFHDVGVRERDFGVWKLWEELQETYPGFEFTHSSGLGVLALGTEAPKAVLDLCALKDPAVSALRERIAQIGARWIVAERERDLGQHAQNLVAQIEPLQAHIAHLEASGADMGQHIRNLEAQAADFVADQGRFLERIKAQETQEADLRDQNTELSDELDSERLKAEKAAETARLEVAALHTRIDGLHAHIEGQRVHIEAIRTSASWRLTAPYRVVRRFLARKHPFRRSGALNGLISKSTRGARHIAARVPPSWRNTAPYRVARSAFGRIEERDHRLATERLVYPTEGLRSDRETVLVIIHEATRTGGSILGYNIVLELARSKNVVVLLRRDGEIRPAIEAVASALVVLPDSFVYSADNLRELAQRCGTIYAPLYVVANTSEARYFVPALEENGIPVVSLLHEFSSNVMPVGTLYPLFAETARIVFSAPIVAASYEQDYRILEARAYRILPQGVCQLPEAAPGDATIASDATQKLRTIPDDAFLVVGIGTINIRKGVEFFIAAAARIHAEKPSRRVVFAWVGKHYTFDAVYHAYCKEQVERSNLGDDFVFLGETTDLESVYQRADACFLSSRLDPLPNITIDAAAHGIPVICFDQASGMAELLSASEETRDLVVPHLDAAAAAAIILDLSRDPARHAALSQAMRALAERNFDMTAYVAEIDALGHQAAREQAQIESQREGLATPETFNAKLYLGFDSHLSREEAIERYLSTSNRAAPRARTGAGLLVRRPLEGFHPLVYAEACEAFDESTGEDPLVHFLRTGKPEGRWSHPVITPRSAAPRRASDLRVAVHAHFHYTDLLEPFLERLKYNRTPVDLFLTATNEAGADELRTILRKTRQTARIDCFPNRGRDFGPMLTGLGLEAFEGYDIVGHFHGKRSPHVNAAVGEGWREFLWNHLVGGEHPMMDHVLAAFSRDERLGLVFAEDPHLNGWDTNRRFAEDLARRMNIDAAFPHHFDFPIGTMFWARVDALKPMLAIDLDWDDYPAEPLPIDGTMLHALERLIPFAVAHQGFHYATTYVENSVR